jgi:predicted homoserine dehydrogenase-like protein
MPASDSLELGALPIGLAHKVPLLRDVSKGQVITWSDVRTDPDSEAVKIRREMERHFAPQFTGKH